MVCVRPLKQAPPVPQVLEEAHRATVEREASMRLEPPPPHWTPQQDPTALVEFIPLDLYGTGVNALHEKGLVWRLPASCAGMWPLCCEFAGCSHSTAAVL